MAGQLVVALGEDGVQHSAFDVERNQHGRLDGGVHLDRGGLRRIEQHSAQFFPPGGGESAHTVTIWTAFRGTRCRQAQAG